MYQNKPYRLASVNFHGLVDLESDGCHRACIIELGAGADHDSALVFLDAWRGFPQFGFVYLRDDVPIEGAVRGYGHPMTCEMGQRFGLDFGIAFPGTIFKIGDKEVLWVIDHHGDMFPLTLSPTMGDHDPSFRQFHWWVLGDEMTGDYIDPAAFVTATSREFPKSYNPRGWGHLSP